MQEKALISIRQLTVYSPPIGQGFHQPDVSAGKTDMQRKGPGNDFGGFQGFQDEIFVSERQQSISVHEA